jgi:hypothetical protein
VTTRRRHIAPLLFALLAALCATGCAKKKAPAPTISQAVYTVRAEVVSLPDPADPRTEFRVHHEAIPDFRASMPDGPLGMKPMIMPFTVGPGVSLEGVHAGDKVEIRFQCDYDLETGVLRDSRVVSVTPLPADTTLNFAAP